MRQLVPIASPEVDPLDLYPSDPRPPHPDRPWLMMNMVASVDGATAVDGVSADLGGAGDSEVFRAIRASCDWILAAAGTVRAERYRVPRSKPEVEDARRRHGRTPSPRLAVVTASVDLSPDLPLFADQQPDEPKPLIITGNTPPPERVAALADRAEWHLTSEAQPTPHQILAALFDRGAKVLLAEGGPSLNGQLVETGLVDEVCLSISPHLVGGNSSRIVKGASTAPHADLTLDRLLEHDGTLFARYLRN